MKYSIVENSIFARLGRVFMKSQMLAMVIGKSIHLSGVSKDEFLNDTKWLKHELIHIQQYKKHGTIKFLVLYIVESIKNGYYNNKFEKEARDGAEDKL
jgi:hypothetical protein